MTALTAAERERILGEDDLLCWRCGQSDSEHSWYGGITYCASAFIKFDGYPEEIDLSRTFQAHPPQLSDAELIRRMESVRDTRDWML